MSGDRGGRSPATTASGDSLSGSARVLLMAVRIYQTFFSAMMPSACKFYPSCSRYAAEAIEVHGARRGAWLALRRLGRCHPFTRGGVDLVPDAPLDSPGNALNHRVGAALVTADEAQRKAPHDSHASCAVHESREVHS